MAISFPSNPADGDTYSHGGVTYTWDASPGYWKGQFSVPTIPGDVSDLTDTTNLLFDGAFSSLTGKPTTLAGYGITDGGGGSDYPSVPDWTSPSTTISTTTTWSQGSLNDNDWVIAYAVGGGGATSEYDAGASGSDQYSTGGGGGGGAYILAIRAVSLNGATLTVGAGAIGTGTRQTNAPSGGSSVISLTSGQTYTAGGGQGGTSSSGGGGGGTGGTGGYLWYVAPGLADPFAATNFSGGDGGRGTSIAGGSVTFGGGGGAGGHSSGGPAGTSTYAGNGGAFRANGGSPGGGAGHDRDAGHTDGGSGSIRLYY